MAEQQPEDFDAQEERNREQEELNRAFDDDYLMQRDEIEDNGQHQTEDSFQEAPHNDDAEEDDYDDDDDDDDDDVQVTIGDIKSAPSFPYGSAQINLNINKRGSQFGTGQTTSGTTQNKTKSGIDMDAVGTIDGVSIYDVNLDQLEEKPWRKPGADITDYFNYGFNEDTWKLYCERQRKLRLETNPNMVASTSKNTSFTGNNNSTPNKVDQPIPIASVNENSKYAGMGVTKKAGPPPGRKASGTIDVIGGGTPANPAVLPSRRPTETKENFIQVIGNRPPCPPPGMPGMPFPPMSMPPPFGFPPPDFPPGLHPPPGLPMMAPNGQPLPFPPGEYPPMRFSHPGLMPRHDQDHHYDEHSDSFSEGRHGSQGRYDDRDGSQERDRDREYHRSGRGGYNSRDYREDDSYRGRHYREHHEREYHEPESRSREREESSRRSHRDREREKERERGERRERDKNEERDRESRESGSSSRRRHHEHEYDEESRSSSSSRHKHAKRSKRDKDEEPESKH